MAVTIGGLSLEKPVILAPMSGVTDWPFRRLVRQLGGGLVVSEMIASNAMITGVRKELRKLSRDAAAEHPFSLQLAGWEPAVMAEAAGIAESLGASIIDLNLGCPARKVTGRLSGSALMQDELLVGRIFHAVRKSVDVPVTVKMRLGWDDSSLNAPRIARLAEEEGLAMIAVHGRTRCQFYKGTADWHAVAAVRAATSLPLFVNGDITDFDSVSRALAASAADGVMIGRAAMGRPWFIAEVAEYLQDGKQPAAKSPAYIHRVMKQHLDMMLQHYGHAGLRLARKHIAAYTRCLPGSAAMRQLANNSQDAKMVFAAMHDYFARLQDSGCDVAMMTGHAA